MAIVSPKFYCSRQAISVLQISVGVQQASQMISNLQVQDAGRQDHKDNLLRPAPAPAQTKQVRDSLMAGDNTGMTTTELPKIQVVVAIYFRHNNTTHLYKFPSWRYDGNSERAK